MADTPASSRPLRKRSDKGQSGTRRDAPLSRRLRDTRQALGLTQAALATRAGLAPAAVSHFENGVRRPSARNLERLADALSVSVDYLMDREQADRPGIQAMFRHLNEMSDEALAELQEYSRHLAKLDRMRREATESEGS